MSQLSPQEIAEKKKEFMMKFFDYAETPIQKWLSKYFKDKTKTLFPDFKDETNFVNVDCDGKYYSVKLSISRTPEQKISEKLLQNDNMKRAISLLFDATRNVFFPITHTIKKHTAECKLYIPMFNEKDMCFELKAFNSLELQKIKYDEELGKIATQIARLDPKNIKPEMLKEADGYRKKLFAVQIEVMKKYNSITSDDIKKVEEECIALNEKAKKLTPLYIIVDAEAKKDLSQVIKRLENIGSRYYDPEEESELDKLIKNT